jgi:hypothetical protein
MIRSLAALTAAALLLAGCGSASEGLDFKPPAGWTAMPGILGFGHMQMWFKKASDNKQDQMLMLVRGQNASSIDLKTVPQAGVGAIKSQKITTITICGNTRAQYLSAIGTGHNGQNQTMEMVSTPVGNQSYLAMYIRPQTDKPDPDAEAAMRSLCAAKT